MGFFDNLKKKNVKEVVQIISSEYEEGKICAPITGKYILLEEIPDAVFAKGMLGQGCGVIPSEGKVYSPVDGKIVMIADTKHAIGIQTKDDDCILIHVGMDTVSLNGKGFDVNVSIGNEVKCGAQLMTFDMDQIRNAGLETTTAIVLTEEGNENKSIHVDNLGQHDAGTAIGTIE